MARSKHAAALFEVMSGPKTGSASRYQSAARSPNWWFKSRAEASVAEMIDPNDPTTSPIKSSLIAPRIAAVEEAQPPEPATRPAMGAARIKRDPIDPTRPAAAARLAVDTSRAVQFDRMRREVKLRLSLTHAVVAVFAVMMIVALAYVMGKRDSAPSAELTTTETTPAESTDAPRTPPAKPSVLDVNRPKKLAMPGAGSSAGGPPHPAAVPTRARDHDFIPMTPMANNAQGMHVAPPAAAVDARRTIGLNYVIAQSYPSEQTARDARDFLIKGGIPCTVEKGTGFAPNWYSVVSSRGFEHIHTNECENFRNQIEKAGDKFAENGKFNRFEPMLYSWKDSH